MLGNFLPMALAPPKQLHSNHGPVISSLVNLATESFRLNLPAHITPGSHPVVHLAYWHCRLLAYLLMPSSLSMDVLGAASELVNLLIQHPRLRTPLNHHFSTLAACTLLELARVAKTRDEATIQLRLLRGAPFAQSAWDAAIKGKIAEVVTRPGTSSGVDSHNLQRLAEMATAKSGPPDASSVPYENDAAEDNEEAPIKYRTRGDYEDLGFDPRPMLQAGYLNYFAAAEPGVAAE
jgi:hypothetical protein